VLYLDLDVLIQAPLDPLIERARRMRGFHVLREWNPVLWSFLPLAWRPDRGAQSSVFAWIPGEQHHIYQRFMADTARICKANAIDQKYLTHAPRDLHYWPDGWAVSFRRSCLWYFPFNLVFKVSRPKTAKIIVFHGIPRPVDVIQEGNARWGNYRKFGFGPVDWVRDYWQRGLQN
jgi:hypothetical protein